MNILDQRILEKAVPASELSKHFTKKDKLAVEREIRYYDLLLSLRNIRKKAGLTQLKLARKANMPRTMIAKIESGKHNPTVNTLMNLASAMNKKVKIQFI